MPFVSQAQRAYMHIHHPEIAKEFEAKTPKNAKLPYHVKHHKTYQKAIKDAESAMPHLKITKRGTVRKAKNEKRRAK